MLSHLSQNNRSKNDRLDDYRNNGNADDNVSWPTRLSKEYAVYNISQFLIIETKEKMLLKPGLIIEKYKEYSRK